MDKSDIDAVVGDRVRALRATAKLSLEALAERSGVSRSMISLIERGETSPSANVLDRLAGGLGVTLASLFTASGPTAAGPVLRRGEQAAWTDPETGYVRRNLSPTSVPSLLELVEVMLPARARVAYDRLSRAAPVHQQVWVLEGAVEVYLGDERYDLAVGDCLAMRLDQPTGFANRGDAPARYLVALCRG